MNVTATKCARATCLGQVAARQSSTRAPRATRDRLHRDASRARPFEDLGFARVDHHRAIRQGFPEVVLGLGKTPAQIAAIAAEIVSRGSTLLVTRADRGGVRRRARVVPEAPFTTPRPRLIAFRQQDVAPGKGTIVVAAAGTADLPVAEEAA